MVKAMPEKTISEIILCMKFGVFGWIVTITAGFWTGAGIAVMMGAFSYAGRKGAEWLDNKISSGQIKQTWLFKFIIRIFKKKPNEQ